MMPWTSPLTQGMAAQAAVVAAAVPVLHTPRLTLRAPRLADFPAYAAIACTDRGIHIGGPFTEEEAWADFCCMTANWLLRGHGNWAVETHAGDLVGFVLIGFEPGDQEPELGWFLTEGAEGHGYATEAATTARDHAFLALGLARFVSYIDPANPASARVAERLGAVVEGQLDGSDVWVHRPAAPNAVSARVETEGRRKEDAKKTSEKRD
ncbi:GNAT family N-acetyltransferase [Tabrizicola sp.]|uniref:GNAT family N-acetyltransferase n=1 Tax=Tabrizicola sp. TaxID=2005166 RepID=UPI003F3E2AC9